MKKHNHRSLASRTMAAVLAVVMVASCLPAVFAADSVLPDDYRGLKSAQPDLKGYRIQEIRDWDPATDPFSEYLVAHVPLQKRNDLFQATQANPTLDGKAKVMLMQGDYGNAFFESPLYNNDFSNLCMNFWQYTDFFCPWHGAVPYDTPESFYDSPKDSWWTSRGFEFGIVNLPTAAYTNAAHKNGALSIACIYFDPTGRPGQTCSDMFERDAENGFPVANKMVEMAKYYGFDGYFFNNEENSDQSFKDFMKVIRDAGLYVQYYNVGNSFGGKKGWLGSSENRYCDSVFVNYGWPWGVSSEKNELAAGPWDPYETAFYGVESNQGHLNGDHSSERDVPELYKDKQNDHNPVASVALFTPSDYYHRGLTDNLGWTGPWNGESPNQNPDYQWMIAERERMYFSGPKVDPTHTGKVNGGVNRSDIGLSKAGGWVGVADFISERSVIGGSTFYSNFNTGHGMQYFKNGTVSADEEWTNMNLQEILPTWQWWIDSTGEKKLSADFDYGQKETRKNSNFEPMQTPYTQVGAYDGGSSLVLYGELDGKNTAHIFKTDLQVSANSVLDVTYQKVKGSTPAKIGLVMKDAPDKVVELDLDSSATAGGWVTDSIALADYAGKNIAAIYLIADGTEKEFQINLGSIRVSDGSDHTPAAPTGLTLKNAFADGQLELAWDKAEYDEVKQYNVYITDSEGKKSFAGGLYGDAFYVKNAPVTGEITIGLTAVGADGTESEPATVTYNFADKVSELTVPQATQVNPNNTKSAQSANAESGVVDAHWTAPAEGKFDHYELTVSLLNYGKNYEGDQVFTATAPADATSFKVPVPVRERYDYLLEVRTVSADGTKSEPICFQGKLKDTYARPLTLNDVYLRGNTLFLKTPKLMDWYRVHMSVDNKNSGYRQRATSGARVGWDIQNGNTLSITMEDYVGNVSEPLVLLVNNGKLEIPSGILGKDQFPNPDLLTAVKTQIGTTENSLKEYEGPLDLSNLQIDDLTGLDLIPGLTEIKFNNNTALTELNNSLFADMPKLNSMDISGCTGLTKLDISGLNLEHFIAEGEYASLDFANISNNRFDLSEKTVERTSLDTLMKYTGKLSTDIVFNEQHPVAYSPVNLLNGKTVKLAKEKGTKDLNDYTKPLISLYENNFDKLAEVRINGISFTAADYAEQVPVYDWEISSLAEGHECGTTIDTSVDKTYTVVFTDKNDAKNSSVLTIIVGEGSKIPENLLLDPDNSKGYIIGATNKGGESAKETTAKINDGSLDTKWCPGGSFQKSWIAADLKTENTILKWVVVNTGGGKVGDGSGRNTVDYDLETLDTSKITVDELLALEGNALQEKLADDSIWTVVCSHRNNTEDKTVDELVPPINGRIFRLNILNGDNSEYFKSTRIVEWELHGYPYTEPVDPDPVDPVEPPFRFDDVEEGYWAEKYIYGAVEQGLFAGLTKTTFGPTQPMSRAMYVTVLGRLAGVDKNGNRETSFTDYDSSTYYAPYVAWAVENHIVYGTSETTFEPNKPVSRQEMAAFLYRYCQYAGIELQKKAEPDFKDADQISPYARAAVDAITEAKLLVGEGDGSLFAPLEGAERAQVAALMMRFVTDYKN